MTKTETPWRDEELLRELYVGERLTTYEIADKFSCSYRTVWNWLDEYEIERRSRSEAQKMRWASQPVPYETQHNRGYERWVHSVQENGEQKRDYIKVHRLIAVAEYGFDAVCGTVVHHGKERGRLPACEIPWANWGGDILPRLKSWASHRPTKGGFVGSLAVHSPTNCWECHAPVTPIVRDGGFAAVILPDSIRRYLVVLRRSAVRRLTYLMRQTPTQLPVFGPSESKGNPRLDTSNEVSHAPKPSESAFGRPLTPPYPTTKVVGFGGCRTLSYNLELMSQKAHGEHHNPKAVSWLTRLKICEAYRNGRVDAEAVGEAYSVSERTVYSYLKEIEQAGEGFEEVFSR